MFNNNLKKEALKIHEKTLAEYNASYGIMGKSCELLYEIRGKSVELIKLVQEVVNSIANTPKQFDTELGKIGKELTKFKETEQYAKEAYDASLKAGVNIVGGTTAGIGIASMAPTALMSIATTSELPLRGRQSALFRGSGTESRNGMDRKDICRICSKEGAGMAAGQAFLALAGPIGWGITAASTGISLISLTNKNKDVAEKAVKEAKEIAKAREALDETTEKINALKAKTDRLFDDMNREKSKIMSFMNLDYLSLREEDKLFLGTLVNHTLSLSQLLNETIE